MTKDVLTLAVFLTILCIVVFFLFKPKKKTDYIISEEANILLLLLLGARSASDAAQRNQDYGPPDRTFQTLKRLHKRRWIVCHSSKDTDWEHREFSLTPRGRVQAQAVRSYLKTYLDHLSE